MGDQLLFGWIKFYATLLILGLGAGVAGGLTYIGLKPDIVEASTVVVATGNPIGTRQLGTVAQTVFETGAVVQPALQKLDLDVDEDAFLGRAAQLRPVPDTNTLIVVGRSRSQRAAGRISMAMATSLADALNQETESNDFRIFSGPQSGAVRGHLSDSVALALGGIIGIWLMLAVAIIHYRARRPVLNLRRALEITPADRATVLHGGGWSWMGALRPAPGWRDSLENRARIAALHQQFPSTTLRFEFPGGRRRRAGRLLRTLRDAMPPEGEGAGALALVVAHAGSSEESLAVAPLLLDSDGARLGLVWIR